VKGAIWLESIFLAEKRLRKKKKSESDVNCSCDYESDVTVIVTHHVYKVLTNNQSH